MQFKPADPNDNYPRRWVSEGGKWELGLAPVIFGVRVQVALVGDFGPVLDYCAGADPAKVMTLLVTVAAALEPFAEDCSRRDIRDGFPGWEVRPIFLDPVCWPRLQEMAKLKDPATERTA